MDRLNITIDDLKKFLETNFQFTYKEITRVKYIKLLLEYFDTVRGHIFLYKGKECYFILNLNKEIFTNKVELIVSLVPYDGFQSVYTYNYDNYGIRQLKIKIYQLMGWI